MRKAFIAVLMGASALVACSQTEEAVVETEVVDAVPAETAPAAADTATPAAEVAAPTDRPVRKAGLWEITSTGPDGEATSTLCVSNATEVHPRANAFAMVGGGGRGMGGGGMGGGGMGGGGPRPGGPDGPRPPGAGEGRGPGGGGFGGGQACEPTVSKTAAGWQSVTACSVERGESTIKTSGTLTLTGDLATRYTVKGSRTTSGSPREEANTTRPVSITGTYKGPCPAGTAPGDLTNDEGDTRNVLQGRGGGRQ